MIIRDHFLRRMHTNKCVQLLLLQCEVYYLYIHCSGMLLRLLLCLSGHLRIKLKGGYNFDIKPSCYIAWNIKIEKNSSYFILPDFFDCSLIEMNEIEWVNENLLQFLAFVKIGGFAFLSKTCTLLKFFKTWNNFHSCIPKTSYYNSVQLLELNSWLCSILEITLYMLSWGRI